jgi:hypothetical protein
LETRPVRRLPAVLASLALTVTLVACGGNGDDSADATPTAEPTAAPTAAPTAEQTPCEDAPPTAEPGPDATTDLGVKPVPEIGDGDPPCELQITDVVVGEGEEAVAGVQAAVKYVGVLYEDGSEFDSSWSRSPEETLPFEVGAPGIIPGFDQGVTGMREGGRRQIVIPSDLAYGPGGQGPIPPGATLVFVIDLVEVTLAP